MVTCVAAVGVVCIDDYCWAGRCVDWRLWSGNLTWNEAAGGVTPSGDCCEAQACSGIGHISRDKTYKVNNTHDAWSNLYRFSFTVVVKTVGIVTLKNTTAGDVCVDAVWILIYHREYKHEFFFLEMRDALWCYRKKIKKHILTEAHTRPLGRVTSGAGVVLRLPSWGFLQPRQERETGGWCTYLALWPGFRECLSQ